MAAYPAIVRAVVVRAPRPHGIGHYALAGRRGVAGFGQGIAFAGAGGGDLPPATGPGAAGGSRRDTERITAADFLSDHTAVRAVQRWLYKVAWGEEPEETDYLKEFPIEADVFPKRMRGWG